MRERQDNQTAGKWLVITARISAAQDLWRRKNTSSTGPDPTVVLQVSEHS